jgi:phosphinothricin acetyltransferase
VTTRAKGALEIRIATASDLPALTDLYNGYVERSPATFDTEPRSLADRREWLGHYATHGPHRLLVALRDGGLLGYASSSVFRPRSAYATSVETSVYLAEDAVGAGVGSALYAKLFDELDGERIHRAYAGVTLPNPASVALHRKFGFEPVGLFHEAGRKLDRYWSVQWFEKRFE